MPAVSELMNGEDIQFIHPTARVRRAAEDMKALHRGCLLVIAGGKLVGIITERDLVQKIVATGKNPAKVPVSSIMSTPVVTVDPGTKISNAARLMVENRIRRLPVIRGAKVVGMLTATDFARYMRLHDRDDPVWAAASRAADYQTIFE